MHSHEIIAGFSDMKIQFRVAQKSNETIRTLKLHFSYKDNFLCAHNWKKQQEVMVLAYLRPRKKEWLNGMLPGTIGWDLVRYLTKEYTEENILKGIQDEYASHGYLPFFD
jgi:hypothetical protein